MLSESYLLLPVIEFVKHIRRCRGINSDSEKILANVTDTPAIAEPATAEPAIPELLPLQHQELLYSVYSRVRFQLSNDLKDSNT
jgi:hypothetical protein